jgi:hypothetical protein
MATKHSKWDIKEYYMNANNKYQVYVYAIYIASRTIITLFSIFLGVESIFNFFA